MNSGIHKPFNIYIYIYVHISILAKIYVCMCVYHIGLWPLLFYDCALLNIYALQYSTNIPLCTQLHGYASTYIFIFMYIYVCMY